MIIYFVVQQSVEQESETGFPALTVHAPHTTEAAAQAHLLTLGEELGPHMATHGVDVRLETLPDDKNRARLVADEKPVVVYEVVSLDVNQLN